MPTHQPGKGAERHGGMAAWRLPSRDTPPPQPSRYQRIKGTARRGYNSSCRACQRLGSEHCTTTWMRLTQQTYLTLGINLQIHSMDTSLQKYPISQDVRTWLLQRLWRECGPTAEAASLDMSCYFDYYSTRCQRFSRDGSIHICVTTHDALVEIAEQILADATRHEVYSYLGSKPQYYSHGDPASTTHTTLDLCATLLLMAEVGVQKFGFSGCSPLTWSSHQTLRQAVESHFQPEKELQPDNPRLGKMFTARNLSYIGGMRIKWTSNIVDHLLLSDDDQTVFIFHHASFLRYQQW